MRRIGPQRRRLATGLLLVILMVANMSRWRDAKWSTNVEVAVFFAFSGVMLLVGVYLMLPPVPRSK